MTDQDNNQQAAKNKKQDTDKGQGSGKGMWGGRFGDGPSAIMQAINASIDIDKRFAAQDIAGSRAHAAMLCSIGVLTVGDEADIQRGLDQIEQEIIAGTFTYDPALEDIHMHVESRLKEIIGEAAGRLHTARSRNDQVATDFKLWVRDTIDGLDDMLKHYQLALLDKAESFADWVMPGFTHLQTAQPVTLGHHLMAYYEMSIRDRSRLADCRTRLNTSPLGCAALAGTSFPVDRDMTAKALGFDAPAANSLDAVSDRDFALEFLSALSLTSMHLSRIADEIVLWASAQFNFIELSDGFSTGSSIMPQKRNPDAAELVRAKFGRIQGSLTGLLTVMKGLPLAYSKDMQEDKAPVFQAVDDIELALAAMTGMIEDLKPNKEVLATAANHGFSTATDLADWLVRVGGIPFRDAHHVTGTIVKMAEDKGLRLSELPLADMQTVDSRITNAVFDVLSVEASVASRTSFGGTAPDCVRAAISHAREQLS